MCAVLIIFLIDSEVFFSAKSSDMINQKSVDRQRIEAAGCGAVERQLCYFFAAAARAFAAALAAIALLSASFFCCGVMSARSPGFGAAGTAALCGIISRTIAVDEDGNHNKEQRQAGMRV